MKRPRDLQIDLSAAKVLTINLAALAPPEPAQALSAGCYAFEVPGWRPATLNELFKRGNHYSAAKLKRRDRQQLLIAAVASGIPVVTVKRRVSVVLTLGPRQKQVDPDAIWKSLLDALVQSRMLVDDAPAWVEIGEIRQIGGAVKSTRIILQDLTEAKS